MSKEIRIGIFGVSRGVVFLIAFLQTTAILLQFVTNTKDAQKRL